MAMSDNKRKSNSNLASSSLKALTNKRRQVYKPVLDTPYQETTWPVIDQSKSEEILEELIVVLKYVSEQTGLKEKKLPPYDTVNKDDGNNKNVDKQLADQLSLVPQRGILDHCTIGFNSTTGALEKQAQEIRKLKKINKLSDKEIDSVFNVAYVFVCQNDIKPRLLTEHFPALCYTASVQPRSANKGNKNGLSVKLIPLPKNNKTQINQECQNLGKSEAAIFSFSKNMKGIEKLSGLIEKYVPDVRIPWMEKLPIYNKPILNVIKTTAPIMPKKNVQKPNKAQSENQ